MSLQMLEHKGGGDGYRTRLEHRDKDVWKRDGGYMMTDKKQIKEGSSK